MPKTIVSTGRGGTGKTTFVALAVMYLKFPFLLIDLDPLKAPESAYGS